jgi:D-3-phosphoglycerate dehydrogenase
VGRAGAGVNNIPVEELSSRGIPVFNAPGANANAVKELVVAGMLLAARNICQSWAYTRALEGTADEIEKQVELGKKRYAGIELPGRTLGVVGLGYIGRQVANAAVALGMRVIGYDPGLTVEGAWQLDTQVERAVSVEQLLSRSQFVTFHVPLNDATRGLLNHERLVLLPKGATVLNFARAGIVDDAAVVAALDTEELHAYVCDFPTPALITHPKVIALPHLGASTAEAEDNCAVMVVDQVMDYLERGNVTGRVFTSGVKPSEHNLFFSQVTRPQSPVDHAINLLAFAGISVPPFWLAILLIYSFALLRAGPASATGGTFRSRTTMNTVSLSTPA